MRSGSRMLLVLSLMQTGGFALVLLHRYNMLMDLQHREITPEDYETLRNLDSTVVPRTLSHARLESRAPSWKVSQRAHASWSLHPVKCIQLSSMQAPSLIRSHHDSRNMWPAGCGFMRIQTTRLEKSSTLSPFGRFRRITRKLISHRLLNVLSINDALSASSTSR